MWDLSCPDWEQRLRAGRSLVPLERWPLNHTEANRAVSVFDKLHVPDIPGTPPFAEAAGDWWRDIMRALFGSFIKVGPDAYERMIREVFCLVAKKNSKTTSGAGTMLTALVVNRRPRAEFLLVGPTKEVADLAFSQAVGMIEADEEGFLQKRMHIQPNTKTITDRRTKAHLKIKSFDSSVLTGVKPAGVLLDELHEISRDAAAMRIVGQLRGGLLSNPEAFLFMITTQSDVPPSGAFKAELLKARGVRDGRLTIPTLPVLYEFPRDMMVDPATERPYPVDQAPWRDPAFWPMVTPNANRSVRISRLVQDFEAAEEVGLGEVIRWASQHLNVEIGLALRSDAWSGAIFWDAGCDPVCVDLATLLARCDVATVGIDGGGLDDMLGLAVIGRERDTKRWLVWTHAWVHPIALERRKSEAPRMLDFQSEGNLTIVDRMGDDVSQLVDVVTQVDDAGILAMVGLDPVGVGLIVDALADAQIGGERNGVKDERVVGVSQGYQLSGSIKTVGRKLSDGTLVHGGQNMMAWCTGNARIELRGNAEVVTKAASGTAKVDPLMAVFDAAALMSRNPPPPKRRTMNYGKDYRISA